VWALPGANRRKGKENGWRLPISQLVLVTASTFGVLDFSACKVF